MKKNIHTRVYQKHTFVCIILQASQRSSPTHCEYITTPQQFKQYNPLGHTLFCKNESVLLTLEVLDYQI
jgi:hypothetical protein